MITRRGLFKGLFAVAGAAVLKPLIPKPIHYVGMDLASGKDIQMIMLSTATGEPGWFHDRYFEDRYIGNWKDIGEVKDVAFGKSIELNGAWKVYIHNLNYRSKDND